MMVSLGATPAAESRNFHASATGERQAELAGALGWELGDDAPLAPGLDDLLERLRTPRRLADLGIDRSALPEIVSAMRAESPLLGSEDALRAACNRMF